MQFNAIEERVLRYLESRFVAGGGFAHVTSDELAWDNRLQRDQFTRLMARFESLGILEEVSLDGIIAIKKVVCQHVAELECFAVACNCEHPKHWARIALANPARNGFKCPSIASQRHKFLGPAVKK